MRRYESTLLFEDVPRIDPICVAEGMIVGTVMIDPTMLNCVARSDSDNPQGKRSWQRQNGPQAAPLNLIRISVGLFLMAGQVASCSVSGRRLVYGPSDAVS